MGHGDLRHLKCDVTAMVSTAEKNGAKERWDRARLASSVEEDLQRCSVIADRRQTRRIVVARIVDMPTYRPRYQPCSATRSQQPGKQARIRRLQPSGLVRRR